jgi:hypothetical protein
MCSWSPPLAVTADYYVKSLRELLAAGEANVLAIRIHRPLGPRSDPSHDKTVTPNGPVLYLGFPRRDSGRYVLVA